MRVLAFITAVLVSTTITMTMTIAHAQSMFEPREFSTPQHEQRYRTLVDELRCLVCQNQTIAESNADLASDLRREVYRMVEDDRSEEEITGFMVARYGEFVLYRPAVRTETLLLWVGPFVLAAVGLVALLVRVRRRRAPGTAPIDEETRARLQRLIETGDQTP